MEQSWLQRLTTFTNIAEDFEGFKTLLDEALDQMNLMELTKLVKERSLNLIGRNDRKRLRSPADAAPCRHGRLHKCQIRLDSDA